MIAGWGGRRNVRKVVMRATSQMIFGLAMISGVIGLSLFSSGQTRQGRVVSANDFPGQDLGVKINAADKALGTSPGEIVVKGGGTISTQVIISSDHVLRFLPGSMSPRPQ